MGLRWVMPPPPDPYPIMLKYQLIEHCGQRLRSIADIHHGEVYYPFDRIIESRVTITEMLSHNNTSRTLIRLIMPSPIGTITLSCVRIGSTTPTYIEWASQPPISVDINLNTIQ